MDGTTDGVEERKEEGHKKGEGPTLGRTNAEDGKRERNRRAMRDDRMSQMCAIEKKGEHGKKVENDGNGSCEKRRDHNKRGNCVKDELKNAAITTQLRTFEDKYV